MITAGPTREAIDPVRYISNHSSGKMGFALAEAASQMGANVTLIAGPVALTTPVGVKRVDVTSAPEMHQASLDAAVSHDIFIAVRRSPITALSMSRRKKSKRPQTTMICR